MGKESSFLFFLYSFSGCLVLYAFWHRLQYDCRPSEDVRERLNSNGSLYCPQLAHRFPGLPKMSSITLLRSIIRTFPFAIQINERLTYHRKYSATCLPVDVIFFLTFTFSPWFLRSLTLDAKRIHPNILNACKEVIGLPSKSHARIFAFWLAHSGTFKFTFMTSSRYVNKSIKIVINHFTFCILPALC